MLRPGERAVRLLLLAAVVLAVVVALLEEDFGADPFWTGTIELGVTCLFAVEYALRLWVAPEDPRLAGVRRPRLRYALSVGALVDVLAILPGLLWLLGLDLGVLRILRVLRVLALTRVSGSLELLGRVLRAEAEALLSAFTLVVVVLLLAAAGIHLFEAGAQPEAFGSITRALWWAVMTMTTVGYGDVVPVTAGGRLFAGLVALLGIALVSVPTAILVAGFIEQMRVRRRAWRRILELALADGRLGPEEAARLEEIRAELGLSEEVATAILEDVLRRRRQVSGAAQPRAPVSTDAPSRRP